MSISSALMGISLGRSLSGHVKAADEDSSHEGRTYKGSRLGANLHLPDDNEWLPDVRQHTI